MEEKKMYRLIFALFGGLFFIILLLGIALIYVLTSRNQGNNPNSQVIATQEDASVTAAALDESGNQVDREGTYMREILAKKETFMGQEVIIGPVKVFMHNVEDRRLQVRPSLGEGFTDYDQDVTLELIYNLLSDEEEWYLLSAADRPVIYAKGEVCSYNNTDGVYLKVHALGYTYEEVSEATLSEELLAKELDRTVISCAKTLVNNQLDTPSKTQWIDGKIEEKDAYGRYLVALTCDVENLLGATLRKAYWVVLQEVLPDGTFYAKTPVALVSDKTKVEILKTMNDWDIPNESAPVQPDTQNEVQTPNSSSSEAVEGIDKLSYIHYTNDRYGFSIAYPAFFTDKKVPTNGDGIILTSEDGKAQLIVSGSNNVLDVTVTTAYKEDLAILSNILYQFQKDNWYVISWQAGETMYYKKVVVGAGSMNSFVISYPATEEKSYDEVVEALFESFDTPGIGEVH